MPGDEWLSGGEGGRMGDSHYPGRQSNGEPTPFLVLNQENP